MKNIFFLLFILFAIVSCKKQEDKPIIPKKVTPIIVKEFGYELRNYTVINDTIKSGESFGIILDRHHVNYPKINKIADSVKDVFDVRRVRAGKPYTILASKDSTEKAQIFIYKHDKINATIIDFKDSTITAVLHKKPIKTVEKIASGIINSNLSVAMDSLNLSANLTWEIADIYAWTLDFYKLQKGDSFKFIYEERYINDSLFAGYGNIKAAIFKHNGQDLYAYRFLADTVQGITEYYDEKGNMLRSQFLKSPIKLQYRISSRYNLNRRIAHYNYQVRAHRGTDFAAANGTPIMATASGTVTESTKRGGNGNYVAVKHNSIYTTKYLHMSKRNVKVGQYVKQGDIIGFVGSTGSSSGNHVCYRFWKNGREVDPLDPKTKLPEAEPLKESIKPGYLEFIKTIKYQLDHKQLQVPEPAIITKEIL